MEKILKANVGEKIVFEIDSRYKINKLIKFIRLNFNNLEIRNGEYFVYYDKDNFNNHKLLVNSLANFYLKNSKDELLYKKILLNLKKDLLIKIKKHQVTFDKKALYIDIIKISSKEFEIRFANPKKNVYDFIKGLFLFDILDLDMYKLIISLNENTINIVNSLISKKTIMGYKVIFKYDETIFNLRKNFSIEGSLKEYLNKIRNALELFGVDNIYEWDKIKKEYRKLAKKYHPDLHRNKPELIQKIYEKKFRKVKESFELLEEYYNSKVNVHA